MITISYIKIVKTTIFYIKINISDTSLLWGNSRENIF